MRYELVVIWEDGTKEIHEFQSVERAEEAGRNYKMAFGGQVAWYGVRRKRE